MLQAIRSKASSLVVKALFGVLVVTFAIWGIGDIFRNRSTDTSVASVGGLKIGAGELQNAVRADMERLRGVFGGTITLDQAKQLGIVNAAFTRIVETDLLELEADRLGIRVGDTAVRKAILSNPNFRGAGGTFDHNVYNEVLATNRLSEGQYEALLRGDLERNELTISLTEGVSPPAELLDAIFRAQAERRVAEVVTLLASAAPSPGQPSDSDLQAFYRAHLEDFHTPERRDFTLAVLRLDAVASRIAVPDDRLKDEYKARLDEFHKPEQRRLEQMLLPDEAKAKEAEAQLAAGKKFADVAKAFTHANAASLDLGWVRHEDLPKPLADAVFAAKQDGVTAPVQTSFGWHIVRVVAVKPALTETFDQAKDQIKKDVARDMAGDRISKLANQIDDALAGGGKFDAVVAQFGLAPLRFDGLDAQGRDAAGKTADVPQAETVLRTAFATDKGLLSQLSELGDDGYFLVRVDGVTPAGTKSLADARADAVRLWQDAQRRKELEKIAAQMADAANAGRSLKELAANKKLVVTTTTPLLRTGGANLSPALIAKLFEAKPGQAVSAASGGGFAVAQLKDIVPADPAKDKAALDTLSHRLAQQLQSEFLGDFSRALRRRFPVEVNQANFDRAL
jgi:peptidyl-prolyl cis-trans isomerase D